MTLQAVMNALDTKVRSMATVVTMGWTLWFQALKEVQLHLRTCLLKGQSCSGRGQAVLFTH